MCLFLRAVSLKRGSVINKSSFVYYEFQKTFYDFLLLLSTCLSKKLKSSESKKC